MKMNARVAGLVVFLFAPVMICAQVPPGRWQKMDAQPPGVQIIVELKQGESISGAFKGSTAEALTVLEISGKERLLRKADVRKIASGEKRSGPLWNGALIGFLSGFIPTAAIASHYGAGGGAVLGGALIGGIGAAIGTGIDAAIKGHETFYRAPEN
jgi:hypothetical protein